MLGITGNPAFEALKVYLIKEHNAKVASGGKEIVKKCHICGDSRDPSSRHMYIGLKDGTIVYNCFKCNSSGLVDRDFLRSIDCTDVELMRLCFENHAFNYRTIRNSEIEQITKIMVPKWTFRDTPGNRKKIESISRRMGHQFTQDDLSRFKIVLNLREFLEDNDIPPASFTRTPEIVYQLSEFYVGFLSMDNKYINLRILVPEEKVHPSIRSRYIKYNIFDLDKGDYYVIPTIIRPDKKLKIRIAEGPFDIIGVYLFNKPYDNEIYAAINGKSYLGIIKYLISRFGFMDATFHIYADNDVDSYEIQKISNFMKPYGMPIFLHRNTMDGEKDFGVSADRIIDGVSEVW